MTQDEIIELARQAWISDKEAQLITEFDEAYISCTYATDLLAFAKLVEAKATEREREACAKLCEKTKADIVTGSSVEAFNYATKHLAELIRARGEK